MNNCCEFCEIKLGVIKNIIASRMFPIKCQKCGREYFRSHDVTYYGFSFSLSIGLILAGSVFILKGGESAVQVAVFFLFLTPTLFILECFFKKLKIYSDLKKNKDTKESHKRVVRVIIFFAVGALAVILKRNVLG